MILKAFFILLLIVLPCSLQAGSSLEKLHSISSSSILLVDENQQVLETKNPNQLFIPASTIKILTSLIALDYWGKDHQFKTDFYFDAKNNNLWIKGYGDPFLVSEELDKIVEKIRLAGINELDGIGIDSSYFSKTIQIDGQGNSLNPYDAAVGAVAANFNTINIRVYENSISSSEKQTPLTPLANELSKGLGIGTHRISLGNAEHTPRYFSELLKAKLNQASIPTNLIMLRGKIPSSATHLFTHKNSRTLESVIGSMLEFSNNFIANQLFLKLGAEMYKPPANMEKSQKVMQSYIENNFNWTNYMLVEGAGLSRQNKLNAQQLIDVLDRFKTYRSLLPEQSTEIYAKTGTLKNISTYAGYIQKNGAWVPFAILINQPVDFNFRKRIAEELLSIN